MSKKEKLMIIGNGFDLQAGLKSTYKDFIKSIDIKNSYSQIWSRLFKIISEMTCEKKEILTNTWTDFEECINKFLEFIFEEPSEKNSDFNGKYISSRYIGMDKIGTKLQEGEIYYLFYIIVISLTKRCYFFQVMGPEQDYKHIYKFQLWDEYDREFKEKLWNNLIKKLGIENINLLKDLLENDRSNLINSPNDGEKIIAEYNEQINKNGKFIIEANSIINKGNIKNVFEESSYLMLDDIKDYVINILYSDLKLFEKDFEKYMIEQESKKGYKSKVKKIYNNLKAMYGEYEKSFYPERPKFSEYKFNILSFNYTNIDKCLDDKKINIFNINGKLSQATEDYYKYENIVFGVNDETRNKMIFTKNFQNCSDYRNLKNNKILINNLNIDEIIVYGHNLGKADYNIFFNIFDNINLFDSEVVLKFVFSIYDESKRVEIKNNSSINVFDLIKSYENSRNRSFMLDKLIMEDRLHIKFIEDSLCR